MKTRRQHGIRPSRRISRIHYEAAPPWHHATKIRSCGWLGIIFTLIGALAVAVNMRFSFGRFPTSIRSLERIAVSLVYLVPGILYIVFAVFLRRRRRWAVVATLALALMSEILPLMGLVRLLVLHEVNFIALFIFFIWAAALGQLIFHLFKSFEAIKIESEYSPRGFEPLPVNTIRPTRPNE